MLLPLLFLSLGLFAHAEPESAATEDLPSIAELYREYIDANGGRSNLADIQSLTLRGKFIGEGSDPVEVVVYRKRPNLLRNRITFPKIEINEIYNNGKAWRWKEFQNGNSELVELKPDEARRLGRSTSIEGVFFKLGGRDDYGTVVAIDEVQGVPAYRIEVSPVTDPEFSTIWLSSEHFQEVKLSAVAVDEASGSEVLREVYFSDFSKINGVYFAGKAMTYADDLLESQLLISSVRVNVGLFDSFFEKPKNL